MRRLPWFFWVWFAFANAACGLNIGSGLNSSYSPLVRVLAVSVGLSLLPMLFGAYRRIWRLARGQ